MNPFSSCLPLIIQMPVFFALYYTIRGADYLPKAETDALYNAAFLWLPKLGEPDPYHILLVVYVATQLISTELMLTPRDPGLAEVADARHAAHLRRRPPELPVRPVRVLGDDQPVDDRPAAHHPQEDADRRSRGGGRQQRRWRARAAARPPRSPPRSAAASWRRSWPPRSSARRSSRREGGPGRRQGRRRQAGRRQGYRRQQGRHAGRQAGRARRAANVRRPARARGRSRPRPLRTSTKTTTSRRTAERAPADPHPESDRRHGWTSPSFSRPTTPATTTLTTTRPSMTTCATS